jgi:hypothetical protein
MSDTKFVGSGRRREYRLFLRAVAVASVLVPSAEALALECPAPHALTRPGVLKETPVQTQRVADLLATGDDENRIRIIVNDLRARYPGVENAELVNYLMAADCSGIAQVRVLEEQEKKAQMDRFVRQLDRIIY